MKTGHIVAIDPFGAIDPQDHPAEYRSVDDFCGIFRVEGWRLYSAHFCWFEGATVQPPVLMLRQIRDRNILWEALAQFVIPFENCAFLLGRLSLLVS